MVLHRSVMANVKDKYVFLSKIMQKIDKYFFISTKDNTVTYKSQLHLEI